MKYLVAYVSTAAVFIAIDYVWLSRVAFRFYGDRLGDLLLAKPDMAAAAAFYTVFVVGIVIFAVAPAMRGSSALTAFGFGLLFGFFTYGTYDWTNYATLRGWSLTVSVIDNIWGACLTGFSALMGFLITRQLGH